MLPPNSVTGPAKLVKCPCRPGGLPDYRSHYKISTNGPDGTGGGTAVTSARDSEQRAG